MQRESEGPPTPVGAESTPITAFLFSLSQRFLSVLQSTFKITIKNKARTNRLSRLHSFGGMVGEKLHSRNVLFMQLCQNPEAQGMRFIKLGCAPARLSEAV